MSHLIRSPSLDFYKQIGNKECHIYFPVVGGLGLTVDDKNVVIPVTSLKEFIDWLTEVNNRLPDEIERCQNFERGIVLPTIDITTIDLTK